MSDFQEGGRLFKYIPNKYTPLPNNILDKFPDLSGTKFSIIDHHQLHQDVLTVHQTHLKQQQPQPAQWRNLPVPWPAPSQTSTNPFTAVVAKQEPQPSPQPTLGGRPDDRVPIQQQQQQAQETVESKKQKNPKAPHFWETETNITKKIKEWNQRQNQKLQNQQQPEQSPETSEKSPQSTQSIFQTQHNFASLEPQLFPEHFHPEVPVSELWQYNPNLQLTPPQIQLIQPPWTHLQSSSQYQVQGAQAVQVQSPFLTPANKFLQPETQLLQ